MKWNQKAVKSDYQDNSELLQKTSKEAWWMLNCVFLSLYEHSTSIKTAPRYVFQVLNETSVSDTCIHQPIYRCELTTAIVCFTSAWRGKWFLSFYLRAQKLSEGFSKKTLEAFLPLCHSKAINWNSGFLEQKLLSRGADWFCWQMTCYTVGWQTQPREYEGGKWRSENGRNMRCSAAFCQLSHLTTNSISHLQGESFYQ